MPRSVHRNYFLMFGLASVASCVASCAPTADVDLSVRTNRPQFRHDNARSGVNPKRPGEMEISVSRGPSPSLLKSRES
jgi:cobalamin biosynthesis protein CobT